MSSTTQFAVYRTASAPRPGSNTDRGWKGYEPAPVRRPGTTKSRRKGRLSVKGS
jgi:hypothetical protein